MMRAFLRGLWRHGRERGVLPPTAIRVVLCTLLAVVPILVGIPTQYQQVSVAYFLPLVFGVLGALTLTEHTQWLRPRNRLLWLSRAITTAVSDLVCLAPLILTLRGSAERTGILAGALVAAATAMIVACMAQEFAWLGAALVGFVCLLAVDQPVVLYLSAAGAVATYSVCLVTQSVLGPRP